MLTTARLSVRGGCDHSVHLNMIPTGPPPPQTNSAPVHDLAREQANDLTGAEKFRAAEGRFGDLWPRLWDPMCARKACVRCPLLRVDPAQMPRLEEIHANLGDRLQEAKNQGLLGEVAAIETTLAAAAQKLEAMRELTDHSTTVHLGMPDVRTSTGRSSLGRVPWRVTEGGRRAPRMGTDSG